MRGPTRCAIVPPYLLARIARIEDPRFEEAARAARRSLVRDEPFRELRCADRRPPGAPVTEQTAATPGRPRRRVYDAERAERLPGVLVRAEGAPETGDAAIDEAYAGLGDTYALYEEQYERDSIDGLGMALEATVHYGRDYDNAFWDGERMVFGDGDGQIFQRFTRSLSVIGHELAHGVTEHTTPLRYRDQSGALNEHVSDVFGALVEQYTRRQTAADASWLIGEGLFTDRVEGEALRSMVAPGTAYDDDVIGRDPQPAHMRDFIATSEDNGGVHLNSGIPNRAFAAAALALGGHAWERAGQIWYDVLVGGWLSPAADFAEFATATTGHAADRFGEGSAEHRAVSDAWKEVGVDAVPSTS